MAPALIIMALAGLLLLLGVGFALTRGRQDVERRDALSEGDE